MFSERPDLAMPSFFTVATTEAASSTVRLANFASRDMVLDVNVLETVICEGDRKERREVSILCH
jgi:hypothetical protein